MAALFLCARNIRLVAKQITWSRWFLTGWNNSFNPPLCTYGQVILYPFPKVYLHEKRFARASAAAFIFLFWNTWARALTHPNREIKPELCEVIGDSSLASRFLDTCLWGVLQLLNPSVVHIIQPINHPQSTAGQGEIPQHKSAVSFTSRAT